MITHIINNTYIRIVNLYIVKIIIISDFIYGNAVRIICVLVKLNKCICKSIFSIFFIISSNGDG